jgi:hypothetical protein
MIKLYKVEYPDRWETPLWVKYFKEWLCSKDEKDFISMIPPQGGSISDKPNQQNNEPK